MSRHRFQATSSEFGPVTVWMGYDRPLDGFFFTVFDRSEDKCLYDNLRYSEPHPKSLDKWIAKAKEFGIALPAGLLEELQSERDNKIGNKVKTWDIEP